MKCKINNAVQLIRSQGEQILRGEEGKNARQHGKKRGRISGSYSRIGMEKYPKRRESAGDGENSSDQQPYSAYETDCRSWQDLRLSAGLVLKDKHTGKEYR